MNKKPEPGEYKSRGSQHKLPQVQGFLNIFSETANPRVSRGSETAHKIPGLVYLWRLHIRKAMSSGGGAERQSKK